MANVIIGNRMIVDSAGVLTTARTKIAYMLFIPNNTAQSAVIKEQASDSAGITIANSMSKEMVMVDTSRRPMTFNNGVYIESISSGAKLTIVTTSSNDV